MMGAARAERTAEPSSRLVRVVDIIVTVILMLAGLGVVGIWVVLAPYSIMATDTCGPDDCDLRTFGVALDIAWFVPPVIYLAASVWAVIRMTRHRLSWWVPVVGSAAAYAVWYFAYEVMLSTVAG